MRIARSLLALALVVGVDPGLIELAQDGAHLVLEGHTDHDGEAEACDEHGCAPTGHHCDCCATMQVVASAAAGSIPPATPTAHRWPEPRPDAAPLGVRRRLLRPPTA